MIFMTPEVRRNSIASKKVTYLKPLGIASWMDNAPRGKDFQDNHIADLSGEGNKVALHIVVLRSHTVSSSW